MAKYHKEIPCGGFSIDTERLEFVKVEDTLVLTTKGEVGGVPDGEYIKRNGDDVFGSLAMNGNTISDVDIIANQVSVQSKDKTSAIHFKMEDSTNRLCVLKETSWTGSILPLANIAVASPVQENDATNKTYVDSELNHKFDKLGGELQGDVKMNNHSIEGVGHLEVDGVLPIYVGSTIITPAPEKGVRYGGNIDGSGAILKPQSQSEYAPLYVGDAIEPSHALTKKQFDDVIKKLQGQIDALSTSLDTANENIRNLTNYKIKYEELMKRLAGEV